MINRCIKLSKNNNLFVFGARGTGKTTLIQEIYSHQNTLWIDLLRVDDENRFSRSPQTLQQLLKNTAYDWVVIDEIQKVPKLLDLVHIEIQKSKTPKFILTGSSARKLKRGGANLLAGRAFTYTLHPFTHYELKDAFHLDDALRFGTLPGIFEFTHAEDKNKFLSSYVNTYIKEEVRVEQLVRNIDPFRDFLEIAAQTNGQIINYRKIAIDVGVDDKTIKNYFTILEDTLIGFFLPPFHRSVRKRQRQSPKFYLFDPGVKRALDLTLSVDLPEQTYAFGKSFEQFVILEVIRLNEYFNGELKISYFRSSNNMEIDLVINRPGKPDLLVEIKSYRKVEQGHITKLHNLAKDWDREVESQIWSRDSLELIEKDVRCLPWMKGLQYLFPVIHDIS